MTSHERVERYAPLIDLSVRSDGDGRIIDAYAAVFDSPQEIRDRQGHYFEIYDRTAFDRTIAQRNGQFQFMFNHGKTMYGTPSERFSMPIGNVLEVRAEPKGLWTSSRVSATPLGDEVLELVNDGAIRGYSFSGEFRASIPADRTTFGPDVAGNLTTVRRTEVAMREFGPTPFPAFEAAHVVGVRADVQELLDGMTVEELAEFINGLGQSARADLAAALNPAAADPGTGNEPPPDTGHRVETTRTHVELALDLLNLDLETTP